MAQKHQPAGRPDGGQFMKGAPKVAKAPTPAPKKTPAVAKQKPKPAEASRPVVPTEPAVEQGFAGYTDAQWKALITPAIPSPYTLKTLNMMEMSNGVAWVGHIMQGEQKIGDVEDRGDGGGTWVRFSDRAADAAYQNFLKRAYPNEQSLYSASESLVAYLVEVEEGSI